MLIIALKYKLYDDKAYNILRTIFINGPKIPFDCEPLKGFDTWNNMLMDAATHQHDQTRFVNLFFRFGPETDLFASDRFSYQLAQVAEKSTIRKAHSFLNNNALVKGSTAVAKTARAGRFDMVELLLRHAGNPNQMDYFYEWPYDPEARSPHEKDLTEKEPSENSFNEKDSKGKDFKEEKKFRSAFHIAMMIGHAKIVKLSLKNGADMKLKNHDGRSP